MFSFTQALPNVTALALVLGGVVLGLVLAALYFRGVVARLDAEAHGLRERLDEARDTVVDKERELAASQLRFADLDRQFTRLQAAHDEKEAGLDALQTALDHSREQLRMEFHHLANRILEEKGKSFAQSSQTSLDALLTPFREQIQAFQSRINQVHDASVQGQARLGAEIRQVLDVGLRMSAEAQTLAQALKGDKKTAGNWGKCSLNARCSWPVWSRVTITRRSPG
ncbi:DNA recombination protein RmuC [Neopusillimonas aromaticivorans]|nr:DNA recombination protein RmuC [Neopusillimonas aromaticivorans]WJJ94542.1 DNA recombination protein RmuC [Neopusillimonas aromaticivorans]